ncbi:MAG TPA: LysR family transcriptional regulator [Phenylobacterium sp.]|nr:LysR family transcriptional regulator [Phenylobacterium sp.]
MNFAAFDLNLLRVFHALMRERSVTRAGEQIGLSQPAVSQALNRLRAVLDDQLFVRVGAQMQPTPRAEALAPAVRDALEAVEAALLGDRQFDPASTERTYTLMGADFVSTLIMPPLYALVSAQAPKVRMRLVDTARGEIGRLLLEGAIDLAIEAPETMPDFISREPLFLSPFAIVGPRSHPALVDCPPPLGLPLDLLCELPHAIRSTDGSLQGYLDAALAEVGRERRVVLGLPHFAAVAQACAEDNLLAALPRQFALAVAERLDLLVYEPPLPVGVPEIQMYWHSRHDRNPTHAWLRDLTRSVAARF